MAIIKHTNDYTFCPLCGGKIDHDTEVRFARGQGYVCRFGRVIRLSNTKMQIFLELMMKFPKTVRQDRLEYLLYDDEEPSVRAVDALVCLMNKDLVKIGIRAKKRGGVWSLYFSSESQAIKLERADAA